MTLLAKAVQTLPIGTAYPVWTGIGAVGTVVLGIVFFHEPASFLRLFFITTLIASIIGLKWFIDMFREMRRKRQLLSTKESVAILERMTNGTLALHGDDGYPYAVPVSYVYADGKIYFHSAMKGHKVDAISRNDKISFCVVEQDDIKPSEFTTYFRSVIVFGKARILTDEGEKRVALGLLADKYSHGEAGMEAEIAKGFNHLLMVEITAEHMTGKESIELIKERNDCS